MTRAEASGLLLVLGLVLGLAFQGSRGLYESTEGRYAEVGREMLETGSWLEPQLDYQPHWTKPPVTYWAVAGGLRLFGRNAWGARFANAIAFALTGLAVAALGRRLWDARTGLIAGLVYLTSLFPFVGAAVLSTDMLLALAETLAILAWAGAWRAGTGRQRPWVFGMWLAFGAAFLVKGPPGLLPLLPLIVFHVRVGRPFHLFHPAAVLAGAALGLWWYGLESVLHQGLLSYLLGQEVVARNLSDAFNRNPQWWAPFVIYLPVLLLGPGLWIPDAVAALRDRRLYRFGQLRQLLAERQSPGTLLFLLVAIPVLVLSLSRSRLPLYLLPLYSAIAVAIARGITTVRAWPRRHTLRVAAVSAVLLITLKGLSAVVSSDSDMKRLAHAVKDLATPAAHVAAFGESRLYGLQFYLDGRLSRIAREPADSGLTLDGMLSDLDRGDVLIVARHGRIATLDGLLAGRRETLKTGQSGGWQLREVSGADPRSTQQRNPSQAVHLSEGAAREQPRRHIIHSIDSNPAECVDAPPEQRGQ